VPKHPHNGVFFLIKYYAVEITATAMFLNWIVKIVRHEIGM